MPPTLAFAVYGRAPMDGARWHAVLENLERTAPALAPSRWGVAEPARTKWAGTEAAAAGAADGGSFFGHVGDRGTIRITGRQTPFDLHTWCELNVPAADEALASVVDAFKTIAVAMDANYGHLHLLDPGAWGDTHLRYARVYDREGPRLSVPPWLLELYLPNLYWGTVFGPEYVKLFGADAVGATPAAAVEELSADHFFLQATANLTDCRDDNAAYVEAARRMMEHLGRDAFVDPADYRRPGRTPDFSHMREKPPPRPYKPLPP
ncbi:MAG TPA: hypothetical protein VG318_18370 [Actinomycetota bacterium]|nr:hypothetical protein [Actinomycetota bacterium]